MRAADAHEAKQHLAASTDHVDLGTPLGSVRSQPSPSPAISLDDREGVSLEMASLLEGACRPRRNPASKRCMWTSCLHCLGFGEKPQERSIVLAERWVRANRASFPRNAVKNTKYNVFTFLPKTLFEQFRYFYNMYFLLVALSQMIPALQVCSGGGAVRGGGARCARVRTADAPGGAAGPTRRST